MLQIINLLVNISGIDSLQTFEILDWNNFSDHAALKCQIASLAIKKEKVLSIVYSFYTRPSQMLIIPVKTVRCIHR